MTFQGQFRDQSSGAPIPAVHVLFNGQLVGVADPAGRWTVDVPEGAELVASHVSYGQQPFMPGAGNNVILLRGAVYTLPEVTITPERKGLPWWAWGLLGYAGGKVLRLW